MAKKMAAKTADPELKHVRAGATWASFVTELAEAEGSDAALGRRLQFADGSRIGEWRRGTDRLPSVKTCALLANIYGYNALDVLRIGGHAEIADLISNRLPKDYAAKEAARDRAFEQAIRKVQAVVDEIYGGRR